MRFPWLREMDSNHRLQIMSLIRNLSSIPQYTLVEDVGLEPLLHIPNVACYHYTTSSK